MSRVTSVLLAAVLSTAFAARAAEPKPDAKAGAAPATGAKTTEGDAAKKAPTRKSSKAKEKDASGVNPQARSVARSTKSVFIYAVDSCARDPKGCDQGLREDAERRFLDSCGVCNTAQKCEAERDRIVAGEARASQDPCAP